MKYSEKTGLLFLLIPVIVWGSVGINVRLLNEQGLEPFTINFFNMLIGTLFIWFYARIKKEHIQLKHPKRTMIHLVLQGVFFGLTVITLFFAFLSTSIANAAFIQKTMAIWVMIASTLYLHEKITKRKILSTGIALVGLAFLLQLNTFTFATGDILALLSSFFLAGFILNGRQLKNTSEYTTTFFQLSVAGIVMLPFMLFTFASNSVENLWMTIVLLLFLGIVNTALTQRLFILGLRYVEASKASIITYVEPVSSSLFAFLYYGEQINLVSFAGIALILLSTSLIFSSSKS